MPKFLIVDDEREVRQSLAEILTGAGHEVLETSSGTCALDLCSVEALDVVVIDILMPEKDGFETITELRRRDPALKIIAMSGEQGQGKFNVLHIAKKLGAHTTLLKPFDMARLLSAVNQVLREPKNDS